MTDAEIHDALRRRFESDQRRDLTGAGRGVSERLEEALRSIGWSAAGAEAVEEVAALAVSVIDACVSGHRSVRTLYRDLADLLRQYAPALDGSLPPAAAFLPAAAAVVRSYIAGA